jgi:hypothetical protein
MRSPVAPLAVSSLLERCLDHVAGEPGAAAIWRVWNDAVGPQIARRAQPVRLRGRTLIVAVSSAPWMQELQLLKRTVLTELNTHLPTPLIGDLFFVLTSVAEDERAAPPAAAPRVCPPPPAPRDLATLPEPLRACFDDIARAWRRRSDR